MSDKICPILWNHISIQQNGDYRVCCQCVYPPFAKLQDAEGNFLNVLTTDINEARNSLLHTQIRKQMLNGVEPPECRLCWEDEKIGIMSKRQHMRKEYDITSIIRDKNSVIDTDKFPLKYIDIRFGNLCNLSCRSCGPGDSSLWYDDYVAVNGVSEFSFYGSTNYKFEKINNVWALKNKDFSWYEDEKFWEMIEKVLPHVDRLYLTGGEPWVNKSQWRLLNLCVEHGYSKNIMLEYNSNLTVLPDNAEEIWSKFKFVNIGCSIDAVGPLAYYVRYPSDWIKLETNILKLGNFPMNNLQAKFSPTISVFNILGFLDVAEWLITHRMRNIRPFPSYHLLHGPSFQNIKVLPLETKQWIVEQYNAWFEKDRNHMMFKDKFQPILTFMMSEDHSHMLPELKRTTEILDAQRGQNINDILPWLGNILSNLK